jgi:hypothetical protein
MRFAALLLFVSSLSGQQNPLTLDIRWDAASQVSKTTPTLQVVVNPMLARSSPVHDQIFKALRDLGADYVRYVPWLPYPRLGVAELEPGMWDMRLIDPMTEDFMKATEGHSTILNFSTIPAWLFKTDKPVTYPKDPDEAYWSYTQGNDLRAGGLQDLADYYARLVSWYVNGGFTDKQGKRHESGHHYKLPYWEVFNEPDIAHHMSPKDYTERYDAVVSAIHRVSPSTKFVALGLAYPSRFPEHFEYFLNPKNHKPGTPLDWISYHFYATPVAGETPDHWQYTFFDQADRFIATIRYIEQIRKRLSPATRTMLNEIGSILPGDPMGAKEGIPDIYWNASGALYAYVYMEAMKLGIDVVGESQLVGYRTQFPSVSMIDCSTGRPNARYQVLKLIHDHFGPGDKLAETRLPGRQVEAQAFVTAKGRRVLLLNKRNSGAVVKLAHEWKDARLSVVVGDEIRTSKVAGMSVELPPFGVAVLQ